MIGPEGQPEETPNHSSPTDGPHHSPLSRHYREQPSEDRDSSSEDDPDEEIGYTDSKGIAPDDEEDDPSTWLADPPPGESTTLSSAHSMS